LLNEMAPQGHWNERFTDILLERLATFPEDRLAHFDTIALWDRYLGDSLLRIPAEQLMPWRVMRRARSRTEREWIVLRLRGAGFDVGTNYPPLKGRNEWGDTVLNFPCPPNQDKLEIQKACEIIGRVVSGG